MKTWNFFWKWTQNCKNESLRGWKEKDETLREWNHMLFYWGWILLFIQFHGIITTSWLKVKSRKTREWNFVNVKPPGQLFFVKWLIEGCLLYKLWVKRSDGWWIRSFNGGEKLSKCWNWRETLARSANPTNGNEMMK